NGRGGGAGRVGVAIGDQIVDVHACLETGVMKIPATDIVRACAQPRLNELMALGRGAASLLRRAIVQMLVAAPDPTAHAAATESRILVPIRDAELLMPAEIGDYTDFYASIHHATNVGSMFRPDNPLLPNYKWIPIGYHGRASSIVPGGTVVQRPVG